MVAYTRPRMVSHTVCRKSNINSICAFILFLFCFSVPLLWKKPLEGRPSNVAMVVTKGTLFTEKYPGNILVTTKYALNNKCRHHNNYRSKISITQQYRKVDIDTNTIRNTDLEISIYPTLGTYLGMRERERVSMSKHNTSGWVGRQVYAAEGWWVEERGV